MNEYDSNKLLLCPYNCLHIPEIIYSFEPMNSLIEIKCPIKNKKERMKLEDFLIKSYKSIKCHLCQKLILDKEFILFKNNFQFFHINCFVNYGISYDNNTYLKINLEDLFNNCLDHNIKNRFYCLDCKIPLCNYEIDQHDEEYHSLQQIKSMRKSQNESDKFKSIINKQKMLLNKIREMNNKLIQSLEKDIEIKENILKNYENFEYNFTSIRNYENIAMQNDEKYEIILNDIIKKYDDFEKDRNNKNIEEILVNTILSPYYYSLMINNNNNFNNSISNLINKKIMNLNFKKNDNEEKSESNYDEKSDEDNIEESENTENEDFKNKEFNSKEIRNIKLDKSIFNLIILMSGNIVVSSMGSVMVYDSKNLLSLKEEEYMLQKINILKNGKIGYVYEFPDETLFCSAYSKILHLKLIDNDKRYNILGIIELGKYELPSKLISLGDSFLAALVVVTGNSLIKLFIKDKEYSKNSIYNYDSFKIDNNENNNSDDLSAGAVNCEYIDMKKIEKDKEFFPYSINNNLNIDKKLLCSIFEIKKNYINIHNKKEKKYEFISTSNSTYDYGEDELKFYVVAHNQENGNIKFEMVKKINNLSCSTEADSICQLNKKFLCVGLQNHNKEGQTNGFAIINVSKKDINKIIKDSIIYSLYFNYENKILYCSIDNLENGNYFIIKLFEVVDAMEEIFLNNIYEFKTEHKKIIVSLSELKNNLAQINDKNLILVTSSIDCTLRLIKINISNK